MTGKRLALIIANDEYEDESLKELEAPRQDAEALARVLCDADTCDFEVQMLLNKKSYEVDQAIEAFFAERSRDDILLFYFSGHGLKDMDGKLYFATPDTKRRRLLSTAVSASFVNDLMRRSRSRRQVLLLDCCYSGAFARGMISKSGGAVGSSIGTGEHFQGRGRVVLTASDAMQYAYEEDELVEEERVLSFFTQGIVNGIETWKADYDNDGRISLDELYDYVYEYVQDMTPNQRPSKWYFDTQGELIIAKRPVLEDYQEVGEEKGILPSVKPIPTDQDEVELRESAEKTFPLSVRVRIAIAILIVSLFTYNLYSGLIYSKIGIPPFFVFEWGEKRPQEFFVGSWRNMDVDTPGITRLEIHPEGEILVVHAWGKCHPEDCYWGEGEVLISGEDVLVGWDQGFVIREVTLKILEEGILLAITDSIFSDERPPQHWEDEFVKLT